MAQREFRLRAQAGERRFHLVRGVGDEALLQRDVLFETREQIVERRDERLDLWRRAPRLDGRQIVRAPAANVRLQRGERREPARQPEPDEQDRERQDHELRQDHALDDVVGERVALVQRLADLHEHGLRARRALQRDARVCDAHVVAAQQIVAEHDDARRRPVVVARQRQVGFARDEFAARAEHLEIKAVDVVGAQEVERRLRQSQFGDAVDGRDLPGEHVSVGLERAVERAVRDRFRDEVGDGDAHRPQQKERREHPVENLAEQRARAGAFGGVGFVRRRERVLVARVARGIRIGRRGARAARGVGGTNRRGHRPLARGRR